MRCTCDSAKCRCSSPVVVRGDKLQPHLFVPVEGQNRPCLEELPLHPYNVHKSQLAHLSKSSVLVTSSSCQEAAVLAARAHAAHHHTRRRSSRRQNCRLASPHDDVKILYAADKQTCECARTKKERRHHTMTEESPKHLERQAAQCISTPPKSKHSPRPRHRDGCTATLPQQAHDAANAEDSRATTLSPFQLYRSRSKLKRLFRELEAEAAQTLLNTSASPLAEAPLQHDGHAAKYRSTTELYQALFLQALEDGAAWERRARALAAAVQAHEAHERALTAQLRRTRHALAVLAAYVEGAERVAKVVERREGSCESTKEKSAPVEAATATAAAAGKRAGLPPRHPANETTDAAVPAATECESSVTECSGRLTRDLPIQERRSAASTWKVREEFNGGSLSPVARRQPSHSAVSDLIRGSLGRSLELAYSSLSRSDTADAYDGADEVWEGACPCEFDAVVDGPGMMQGAWSCGGHVEDGVEAAKALTSALRSAHDNDRSSYSEVRKSKTGLSLGSTRRTDKDTEVVQFSVSESRMTKDVEPDVTSEPLSLDRPAMPSASANAREYEKCSMMVSPPSPRASIEASSPQPLDQVKTAAVTKAPKRTPPAETSPFIPSSSSSGMSAAPSSAHAKQSMTMVGEALGAKKQRDAAQLRSESLRATSTAAAARPPPPPSPQPLNTSATSAASDLLQLMRGRSVHASVPLLSSPYTRSESAALQATTKATPESKRFLAEQHSTPQTDTAPAPSPLPPPISFSQGTATRPPLPPSARASAAPSSSSSASSGPSAASSRGHAASLTSRSVEYEVTVNEGHPAPPQSSATSSSSSPAVQIPVSHPKSTSSSFINSRDSERCVDAQRCTAPIAAAELLRHLGVQTELSSAQQGPSDFSRKEKEMKIEGLSDRELCPSSSDDWESMETTISLENTR